MLKGFAGAVHSKMIIYNFFCLRNNKNQEKSSIHRSRRLIKGAFSSTSFFHLFSHLFNDDDYILASVCYSKLKLNWLKTETEKSFARSRLTARVGINAFDRPNLLPSSFSTMYDIFKFELSASPTREEIVLYLRGKDQNLFICWTDT